MKRITISAAFLLLPLILMLAGCQRGGGEINFNAVILEIKGNSILVEACEGDDIRRSSDKITFSREDLDDIGTEVGDTVTVSYTGEIMESYPAQVRAVSWSILEKGAAGAEIPPTDLTVAEYSRDGVSMNLSLPDGWDYEISDPETSTIFGVRFWSTATPSLELCLEYHTGGIGICGTGVTFTDMEFENGLTATSCTEELGESEYWFFLIYDEPHTNYAVSCNAPVDLWNEYESEIMAILGTVRLGGKL